jgi:hypothetical protein
VAIDPGAFAFGFIAEGIKRLRQRRRAKRAQRKGEGMAIDLGTRTSTNALVGGGFISQVYVQLVQLIPGNGALEAFLLQPETVAFAAVLAATIIARFSKTPAQPKAL